MTNRRQRGFSMTEGLIASSIMALAITALFGLWGGMFKRNGASRLVGQAGQLARAEVERAKVFGMDNLPTGTYSASTDSALWTGAFSPTSNAWVSGATAYYDMSGNRLAASTTPGVALKMQTAITDTNVLPKTGGYTFQLESRRKFIVTVSKSSDSTVLLQMATIIVPGGL